MTPLFTTPARIAGLILGLAAACLSWTACSVVQQDLPNEAPVVQVREVDTTRVARGGRVRLRVTASDEDDDPLSYRWSAFGAGSFSDSTASAPFWIAPQSITGSSEVFLISVRVIDHQPDTEDPVETFRIEVVQRPPTWSAPGDTTVSFREPVVDLTATASDPDDDALTFSWEVLADSTADPPYLPPEDFDLSVSTTPTVSTASLKPLVPGRLALAVWVTDGSDTLRKRLTVTVEADRLPEGGMVPLVLARDDGTRLPYEIDVYEYPNHRGQMPLLVDDWFQASALCRAQGKRLCTSVEWRFACSGPEERAYSSVDDPRDLPEDYGLRFCNGSGSRLAGSNPTFTTVAPAGSFPNCAAPGVGVYDLTGNAFEWLSDPHPVDGRQGRVSLSGTALASPCSQIDAPLKAVPYENEMDDADRTAVERILGEPEFQGYAASGRGFRCCR